MIFTIVGIRNYLPNGEADYPILFSRLPIGAIVYLRKEPTGSSFPGSISVWDDECNQIGSISKIERRFIELDVPQDGMLPVKVSGHSTKHNCMYFEAENKNGFKAPYIRDVKLEEGETSFPMPYGKARQRATNAYSFNDCHVESVERRRYSIRPFP